MAKADEVLVDACNMASSMNTARGEGGEAFDGGSVSQQTALIVGALCAKAELSKSHLVAEGMTRTPEWHEAIERADFIPTMAMLRELQGELLVAESDLDVLAIATEVEARPLGPTARRLRKEHHLSFAIEGLDEGEPEVAGGLDPLAASVRSRDRLLLTGPIVRGTLLLVFQVILLRATAGLSSMLTLPRVLAVPALAALALALALPQLEKIMVRYLGWVRSADAQERMDRIASHRKTAGLIATHPGAWFQSGESQHFLRECRASVTKSGLGADALERLGVMLALNLCVSIGFAVSFVASGRGPGDWAWVIANLAGLGAMYVAVHVRAQAAQQELEYAVIRGLGIQ